MKYLDLKWPFLWKPNPFQASNQVLCFIITSWWFASFGEDATLWFLFAFEQTSQPSTFFSFSKLPLVVSAAADRRSHKAKNLSGCLYSTTHLMTENKRAMPQFSCQEQRGNKQLPIVWLPPPLQYFFLQLQNPRNTTAKWHLPCLIFAVTVSVLRRSCAYTSSHKQDFKDSCSGLLYSSRSPSASQEWNKLDLPHFSASPSSYYFLSTAGACFFTFPVCGTLQHFLKLEHL